jgi:hypothetical protein
MAKVVASTGRIYGAIEIGEMYIKPMLVTPAIAEEFLQKNIVNRPMRLRFVRQYAGDMTNDRWEFKPVAICFDKDGNLGNGQHTLNAIIMADKPQMMLVATHCTKEQIAAMDVGIKRTMTDLSNFLGTDMRRKESAIAKILAFGVEDSQPHSYLELYEAYITHEEAIDFACENGKGNITGLNSSVLAVIAAAWYTENREDLTTFCKIMESGLATESRDATVIRFRDFCRSNNYGGGKVSRVIAWQKAQAALTAYLQGRSYSKLYGIAKPVFKLPKVAKSSAVAAR